MSNWLSEHLIFAWRFVKSPQKIGTPFPCSSFVAEKILMHVPPPSEIAHRYVEFGPGTGAFTDYLVKKLGENDHLDLVEIDEEFCKLLQKKFDGYSNIKIHHTSILDFQPEEKYDVIITAIPPNAISSPEFLAKIYACYERMIKADGIVSAVEYIGTASTKKAYLYLKSFFSSSTNYENFKGVLAEKASFAKKYLIEKIDIWLNLLPARVTHYQIKKPVSNKVQE